MKIRRLPQSAQHNHATSVAHAAMAWGTVNLKPVPSPNHILAADLNRNRRYVLVVFLARIAGIIDMELAARHRVVKSVTSGAAVAKKVRSRQRLIARLIMHILAACG